MAIAVTPALPVLTPQEAGSVASELKLEAGSIVNATVLKVLAADLVRIAIASLSIDVQTEVALQPGQSLQLAVSQTSDGIRLQLVDPGSEAIDTVRLPPGLPSLGAGSQPNVVTSAVLMPAERVTIAAAAQSAAAVQGSQGMLFANLAAVASANLPPQLQAAIAQVLAQRTNLDENLSGEAVKAGFRKSGLLLEATLASGTTSVGGNVPDLKAALIVLRQVLASLGPADAARSTPAPASEPAAGNAGAAPPLGTADIDLREILLPRLPVARDLTSGTTVLSAALDLLQEELHDLGSPSRPSAAPQTISVGDPARSNAPPPFRGALPAAQAMAEPSIVPGMPLAVAAHRLLEDVDAALARQTLLQVASLPDRNDAARPQFDATTPRWSFEIPFLTPRGTAMAQFEISRDGGGREVEAAKRVWRARFSLDVEPTGPVHAQVSLIGERTSVRMWAERPATAAQLRASAFELGQALAKAELTPGDIEIRDGTPPQPVPARAGHFLDRAS